MILLCINDLVITGLKNNKRIIKGLKNWQKEKIVIEKDIKLVDLDRPLFKNQKIGFFA